MKCVSYPRSQAACCFRFWAAQAQRWHRLGNPAPCQGINNKYHPPKLLRRPVLNSNECFPSSAARINTSVDEMTRKTKHFKKKINTRKLRQEHGKSKATWERPCLRKTKQPCRGDSLVGRERYRSLRTWVQSRTHIKQGVAAHICNPNIATARWDREMGESPGILGPACYIQG